jgi:hypothetical protein
MVRSARYGGREPAPKDVSTSMGDTTLRHPEGCVFKGDQFFAHTYLEGTPLCKKKHTHTLPIGLIIKLCYGGKHPQGCGKSNQQVT